RAAVHAVAGDRNRCAEKSRDIGLEPRQSDGRVNGVQRRGPRDRAPNPLFLRQPGNLRGTTHLPCGQVAAVEVVVMVSDKLLPWRIAPEEIVVGRPVQGAELAHVLGSREVFLAERGSFLSEIEIEGGDAFAGLAQHRKDKSVPGQPIKRRPVEMPRIEPVTRRKLVCARGLGVDADGRYVAQSDHAGQGIVHGLTGGLGDVKEDENRHFPWSLRSTTEGLNSGSSCISNIPATKRSGLVTSRCASCHGAKRHHLQRSMGEMSMGGMRYRLMTAGLPATTE